MYSTSVYYFIPRQTVVVYNRNSARRYQLVYAKTLTLNKGVDNKIQFQYLNQEQRPVDISDFEITFRLINYNGTETLLQKAVTNILPLTGICEVLITANDIIDIDPQMCSYSLEVRESGYDFPTFVNSEAGARGTMEIVNSVLPDFTPAYNITIPTHPNPNPNANAITYYSSIISTSENSLLTLQTKLDSYSGNIQIQGSMVPESEWYNIGTPYSYNEATASTGHTVEGFHPYVRLEFTSTQGNVTQILAR